MPFNANLQQDDAVETSAYQLQTLITKYQSEGWEFVSMGNIETNVALSLVACDSNILGDPHEVAFKMHFQGDLLALCVSNRKAARIYCRNDGLKGTKSPLSFWLCCVSF